MKSHFPVGHRCEFRNEIADTGMPETQGIQARGSVENHAEARWWLTGRMPPVTEHKTRLRLQKPSFESDVGTER